MPDLTFAALRFATGLSRLEVAFAALEATFRSLLAVFFLVAAGFFLGGDAGFFCRGPLPPLARELRFVTVFFAKPGYRSSEPRSEENALGYFCQAM